MATITINYDARNPAIKGLIDALLNFDGVTEVLPKKPSRRKGLDEAIDDVKNGRTVKCDSFEDYLEKINS